MNQTLRNRMIGFGAALAFCVMVLFWAARTSWVEVHRLQENSDRSQIHAYEIADHFQATTLRLNALVVRYALEGRVADRDALSIEASELNAWIDTQKTSMRSSGERRFLNQIDEAYDQFLAATSNCVAILQRESEASRRLEAIRQVQDAAQWMQAVGTRLEDAHRATLEDNLRRSRASVDQLQALVLGAFAVVIGLGLWLGITVYREMIAPLQLKLIETHTLLERQEKLAALGLLAAGVAHEIRNPLTAIKARLFSLMKRLRPGAPERADADVIGNEINRLEHIVRDVLLFARPSDPHLVPIQISELLRDIESLLGPQLAARGVRLLSEPVPDLKLQADPVQIRQVLINLIQNAAESTSGEGRILLRAYQAQKLLQGTERPAVVIEVEDNGSGMPPEVQARLFDPFFTTKESGTGLGLSIAARIVGKHGGALQYRTEQRHGTIFGVVLPIPSQDFPT